MIPIFHKHTRDFQMLISKKVRIDAIETYNTKRMDYGRSSCVWQETQNICTTARAKVTSYIFGIKTQLIHTFYTHFEGKRETKRIERSSS